MRSRLLCFDPRLDRRPLLLCFLPDDPARLFAGQGDISDRCRCLLSLWGRREMPVAFVRRRKILFEASFRSVKRYPGPGDLFFEPYSASVFRDPDYRSVEDDFGRPPLFLIGSDCDRALAAAIVDGGLSERSIYVVQDAIEPSCHESGFASALHELQRLAADFAAPVFLRDVSDALERVDIATR